MADKIPLVIDAGKVRQADVGDIIVCSGIKDSSLNIGCVVFITTNNRLQTDAGITWNGSILGTTNLKSAALTSGRVVLAGTSGVLEDSANLTFDGITLTSSKLNIPSTTASVGIILQNGIPIIHSYKDATAEGFNFFVGTASGNFTMSPGGGAATLASRNLGFGNSTLQNLTTGKNNCAIGTFASRNLTSGGYNMSLGNQSLYTCSVGSDNVAIGEQALFYATGSQNTAVGRAAGWYSTGSKNIFLGSYAGFYETGSYKLFIDYAPRASEADGRIKALVYGIFAAAVADQDLTINGQVGVNIVPTAWLTLPAGSAAAGTAPLKLTAGTNLTIEEPGAIEFDGTNLYFTDSGGTRRTLAVVP